MSDQSKDRFSFLGREFLTWLWFESERTGGRIDTPSWGPVGVEFGQRLTLETAGTIKEGSTVQAEAPSQAEEARTALRVGKKVSKARLHLDLGERQYAFGIDAESLTLSGVKLPTLLAGDDPQKLDERLRLLDELEAVLDELYVAFVQLRRDRERWPATAEAIRGWVKSETSANAAA